MFEIVTVAKTLGNNGPEDGNDRQEDEECDCQLQGTEKTYEWVLVSLFFQNPLNPL